MPATWYQALWVKYIQLTTELVTVPWPQNLDNNNNNEVLFLERRLIFLIFSSSSGPFFQASLRNACLLLQHRSRNSGLEWMHGIHENWHYVPTPITKEKHMKLTLGSWGRLTIAEASSGYSRLCLKPKWVALWSWCTSKLIYSCTTVFHIECNVAFPSTWDDKIIDGFLNTFYHLYVAKTRQWISNPVWWWDLWPLHLPA